MHLTDHDLRQLDQAALSRLGEGAARRLLERVVEDLKEARDRLRQDSQNSSRPPSSDSFFGRPRSEATADEPSEELAGEGDEQAAEEAADGQADEHTDGAGKSGVNRRERAKRHRGRQPGTPGFGRTQRLAVDVTVEHRPGQCAVCGRDFPADVVGKAYGGFDEIDVLPAGPDAPGLRLQVTRHRLLECECACGHRSRYRPPHAEVRPEWQGAGVTDQQLLGPRLAGLIVMLCLRYRLSRSKVRELLQELVGLQLSVGLIDQTLRQSAGQVAPVEDLLLDEIERAGLLHVDETPWPEWGHTLWLWLFNAVTTLVYFIGPRSAEMFVNALGGAFHGHMVSDGYAVYRIYEGMRVRCLAHLLRKARGLSQSTCWQSSRIGQQLLDLIGGLMQAAQAARNDLVAQLAARQAPQLAKLRALCECHQHSRYGKLGEFCREMLNDWPAIVRPLLDPSLPLTNNVAERQLRHWVIARKISFGTRSEQGSRAFALLASIIDTCRARHASAWDYLTAALHAARQGQAMPPLPPVPQAGG